MTRVSDTSSRTRVGRVSLPVLSPRDPEQEHRTATPLELLFDLVFVVAVARAGFELHHELAERHFANSLVFFPLVFFAVYWAWVNFTWFASAYDSDDWLYRLLTFVQMAGVLVLTAGIHDLLVERSSDVVVLGYVMMRLALVTQWVRASHASCHNQATARTYAVLISALQVLWIGSCAIDGWALVPVFLVLGSAELAVPAVAARVGGPTPWHPEHISERYGLFTILVLGETILASANAVVEAVEEGDHVPALVVISASGLALVAAMWWVYFDRPHHPLLTSTRASLVWGYTHYAVFVAVASVSVGIELLIDVELGETELGRAGAGLVLCVPVALFLVAVWAAVLRADHDRVLDTAVLSAAGLVIACAFVPARGLTIVLTAVLAVLAAAAVTSRGRIAQPVG